MSHGHPLTPLIFSQISQSSLPLPKCLTFITRINLPGTQGCEAFAAVEYDSLLPVLSGS